VVWLRNFQWPRLLGHRGLAACAPENSFAGFQAAHQHGLRWVEFDVQRIQTGQLVIFHDEFLGRTCAGKCAMRECCYEDVRDLDIGSWLHARYAQERLITLEEALLYCLQSV